MGLYFDMKKPTVHISCLSLTVEFAISSIVKTVTFSASGGGGYNLEIWNKISDLDFFPKDITDLHVAFQPPNVTVLSVAGVSGNDFWEFGNGNE